MDENGNPVGGASIQILLDDAAVNEKTLAEDQAVYEADLQKGQYMVKVSKAGYEAISYQVIIPGVGTETIPLTAKLKKDATAPKIIGGNIGDKGTSILISVDEPVVAAANASVNVTNEKGEAVNMAAPAVSADGQIIQLAYASGEKLPDGNYIATVLSGFADMAGNALTGSVTIPKTTTYSKIEITSTGFAPSAGQSVAYKIIDNYEGEYDSVSELNLPNAKDLKVKVSVTNKGLDGEKNVPILIGSTENLFDLSNLKKGCKIMVKAEIPELALSSDPVTVEIGDPAEAASFAMNGLTIKQESGVGTDNYTVDYGTEDNPIRLGKNATRKAKIQLLMRDQYGNIMQNAKGQAVTLVSGEDASVIAIKDAASQKESNLVRAMGAENQSTLWNEIAIKGIGSTTLTAYLDNGETTQMEVTVKPPKLQGITTNVSVSPKKLEEVNVMASYFTFNYDEDKKGQYKTPASDLTLSCKEATDGATAEDIMENSDVLENDDHSFKGLRIKATKAAVYTMTLTSKNESQSVDFKVSVSQDEEITDIQLDKASLDIKKGGKAKSVKLNFINKYGEIISSKALKDVETSIGFNLYDISGGDLTDNRTDYVEVGYQKEDGNKATASNDTVTDLSLAYQSGQSGVYVLEVYLTANHNRKAAITLNGSVATAASISISKNITKDDLLIARDQNAVQYIPLTILDEDGEEMSAQANRTFTQTLADTENPDTEITDLNGFVEIVAAKKDNDEKIIEAAKENGAYGNDTFDALKINPSIIQSNADALTYDITVSYGSGRNTITSNTGSIKVCEIRCLNTAKIDPSKKSFTTGTSATVYATAYDQYGSKMDADTFDITLTETGDSMTDTEEFATSDTTSAQNEDLAWPVTLDSKKVGKVTKTFAVTHKAESNAFANGGNGTSKSVTKTMAMNIEVKDPSAITKVTVKNKNLTLRQIDFDGNWSTIDLELVGIDEAGNEMVISAENVDFDYKNMPAYIDFFKEENEHDIEVNETVSNATGNSQTTVQIMCGENELGSFPILFEKAAPTPEKVTEVFNEEIPLYGKPLAVKNDGKAVTISDKPFEVVTNYGDSVGITASEMTDFKSDNSKVKVEVDENNEVTVTVDRDAVKDSTATISAYFVKNGVRARTTFVVTVEQRGAEVVEPSTDAEIVAAAKKAIEDALDSFEASNDTDEAAITSAVSKALSDAKISGVTTSVSISKSEATTTAAGSITGTVTITSDNDSTVTDTVTINMVIEQLKEQTDAEIVAAAKKAIGDALDSFEASNDTDEAAITSAVSKALSDAKISGVTTSVSISKSEATTTAAGSITGTVTITSDNDSTVTDTVTISMVIEQLTE